MPQFDYIIKNAHILDPSRGIDAVGELYLDNGRIAEGVPGAEARIETIDARGCLVTPGLIDFHTHCNHLASPLAICADMYLIPNGVTSTVDAGTAGYVAYPSFRSTVIGPSISTIKAYLNLGTAGCTAEDLMEDYRHEKINFRETARVYNENRDSLIGIKVRLGNGAPGLGVAPLRDALTIAEELGCPVCVHVGGLENDIWEVCDLLRPGDVLTHMYDGKGKTILAGGDAVHPSVRAARERGVIFDVAAAKRNYNIAVARKAVAEGFWPDVISSDVTHLSAYNEHMFMLPVIMSWMAALGMKKSDLFRAVTETPARLMGMEGVIGTLAPGARADVAVFREKRTDFTYSDFFGNTVRINEMLLPVMTIKNGLVCYKNIEFQYGI